MRRAGLLAALFAAGCASASGLKPALKDLRRLPKLFTQELIARRAVSGLELKVYDTGAVTVDGETLSELKSPNSRVRLSLPAFVIRHPIQGLIVFDAGLPGTAVLHKRDKDNEFKAPFEARPGQDLLSQLGRDGVRPAEVKWVVLSHLHFDHVGQVDAFPNATVVADRREWEAQKKKTVEGAGPLQFDPAAMEPRLRLRLVDFSSLPPYGMFDHGLDLLSDGSVVLVDLAGHTPGSMGLWANLDSGPVLLAGDASWILDNCQDLALPRVETMAEPRPYWRSLNIINRMTKEVPRLVVFPGHDLMPLRLEPRPDIKAAF